MKVVLIFFVAVASMLFFGGCEKKESGIDRNTTASAVKTRSFADSSKNGIESEEPKKITAGESGIKEPVSDIDREVSKTAKEAEKKVFEITQKAEGENIPAVEVANGASFGTKTVDAESLYKSKCSGCHGMEGEKRALGKSDPLAGQEKAILIRKLEGYKNGSYGGAMKKLMQSQVLSLDRDQIDALAEYISKMR